MKKLLTILAFAVACAGHAQHINNPYQDHTNQPFGLPTPINTQGNPSNYVGEYQIFLDDHYWNPGTNAYVRIEAVSFPFTPLPEEPDITARTLLMPDLTSYGFNEAPGPCHGWAWNSTNHGDLLDPKRDLMRETRIDFNGSSPGGAGLFMTDHCGLITSLWASTAGATHDCADPTERVYLPHTILKHTIYWVDDDGKTVDSLSWLYDHTRGRMRNYPFCWNCSSLPAAYDVCFRPYAIADPYGHTYQESSNGAWVTGFGLAAGTPNYFPKPYSPLDWTVQLWPDDDNDPFDPLNTDGLPVRHAPYSLLEAPLLNHSATAYAGYDIPGLNGQQPIFFNDNSWDYPWAMVIDKPIDLHLINPSDKIIYNPSDVDINIDGNLYPNKTLVFPSGYTFRTVHGQHPSEADVVANDPMGLHPNPANSVASTLGPNSSIYRIRSGSTLEIQPCVTIMDAVFIVEAGATLRYDAAYVDGNFTVDDQPGSTVEPLMVAPPALPCVSECYSDGWMEIGSRDVISSETWNVSSIPYDGNADGILRIGGTIRVKPGVLLTIEDNVRLEFGPHGRLIIERGARVVADHAIFTSACHNMWHGIEVWGTRDVSQDPVGSTSDQGSFYAGYCMFENAREAVLVARSDDPTEEDDYNGGVAQLWYSNFRNNGRDVHLAPTANLQNGVEHSNRSHMMQNTFTTEGYLVDPAYTDGFGVRRAAPDHVLLDGVKGVLVHYNDFSVVPPVGAPFLPHLRGSGVNAMNSVLSVNSNEFSGLSEAVWHSRGTAPIATAFIRNNNIHDCVHGIATDETLLDEITGNTISVPESDRFDYPDGDVNKGYDHPVGIFTQQSTAFHIEGNTITGNEPDGPGDQEFWSYACVINQSDPYGASDKRTAQVYRNTVYDTNVGVQCEGDNRGGADGGQWNDAGLFIECNDFSLGGAIEDIHNYDITIVSNWISGTTFVDGYLRDQGSCLTTETQAANIFSALDSDGDTFDRLWFDDNTIADNSGFQYRDHNDGITQLSGYSNAPALIDCNFGQVRNCVIMNGCGKPCLEVREAQLKAAIQQLQADIAQTTEPVLLSELQRELAHREAQLRLLWNS
ncbi:MAG: hypothetical protein IPJ76_04705 [Flavobacteriales bacterium]|nr:MAG: hypothetical protein IPJ76_04705 [Flavobacteriales bacterium]